MQINKIALNKRDPLYLKYRFNDFITFTNIYNNKYYIPIFVLLMILSVLGIVNQSNFIGKLKVEYPLVSLIFTVIGSNDERKCKEE